MTREDAERLSTIVERFAGMRIGVVGDLVADVYVHGVPERVSREAPVLILGWESEELIPGGAANTANNLLALGAEVHPVGLVGDDAHGRALVEYLVARGVDPSGIVTSAEYHTVTKTRVMAGGPTRWPTQVVRIDKEPPAGLPSGAAGEILKRVRALADRVDGWIFSDYGYDVAAPGVAAMLDGVRVADSRARIEGFKGFTALTPNEEEAAEMVGHPVLTDGQTRSAGREILERTEAENVVITRGNKGMALISIDGSELFIEASGAGDVTDITGAGDTVTGVLALALAAGADPADAASLANHAAGVVVMKAGAATLTTGELEEQLGRTE